MESVELIREKNDDEGDCKKNVLLAQKRKFFFKAAVKQCLKTLVTVLLFLLSSTSLL